VRRLTDQASGAILERPGLERALREAEAGRFDLLLVYRVDRFSGSAVWKARREELSAEELEDREPLSDDLELLAAQVREMIKSGDPPTRKALLQIPGRRNPGRQPRGDLSVFSLPAVRPPQRAVPPAGFEPATVGLEVRCSVH
jgi:Resolvase, N terminal domain